MKFRKLIWIGGVVTLIAGFIGGFFRLQTGLLHTNFGSIVPWGLWEAGYIYFIGLSAGSFLISSLVYVFGIKKFEKIGRLSVFTSLVTLICALLSICCGLGRMGRFWHLFIYPDFRSMMTIIVWLYSIYFILLLAEFWFLMRRDFVIAQSQPGLRGQVCRLLSLGSTDIDEDSALNDMRVVKVLGIIGVPLAICFHGGVGALFGVVAARPFWHSGMFPILFLIGALVSGGALLIVISAIFQNGLKTNGETIINLGKLAFGLLLLDILFQASELLIVFKGNTPSHMQGFLTMMSGSTAWVYWFFQVGIGMAIPVMIFASRLKNDPKWVVIGALAMVLGFFAVRWNIVVPGLTMEEIHGITNTLSSKRITMWYRPSIMEWMVSVGIMGFGLILFSIGEAFLPLNHNHNAQDVKRRSYEKY